MKVDRIRILQNTGQSVLSSLRQRPRARMYLTSSHHGKKSVTRVVDSEIDREFPIYKVLRIHRHPHVMTYLGFCEDEGFRFYRYEHIDGFSLRQLIKNHYDNKPIPNGLLLQIIRQTCLGLSHMHENGLVHCDLKPDNIMVSLDGDLKLIDFDLSLYIGEHQYMSLHDIIGTTKYIPPECIHIKVYSRYTDMWSFGVMLYQLVTRKLPFDHEINPYNFNPNLMRATSFKHPNLELLHNEIKVNNYTKGVEGLVSRLLSFKDMDRGTVQEILELPWLPKNTRSLMEIIK